MAKIDKQINYDLTYRYETLDEYRRRNIDAQFQKVTGMTQAELEASGRRPTINQAMVLYDTVYRRKWNKRLNKGYEQNKQRTFDSKSYEVPVSASLGIVGSDSPVQTNVSWETPTGSVDYSGQKRKKGSGISYNLGLF